MPRSGSYTLEDLPADFQVRVACDTCGRSGHYRAGGLVKRFGADCPLPDVINRVSADCPRRIAGHASDPCRATFTSRWPWA